MVQIYMNELQLLDGDTVQIATLVVLVPSFTSCAHREKQVEL